MIYKKDIKNYIIKIDTTNENGSGILVKPSKNSQYCYVFTARHVFLDEKEVDDFTYSKFKDTVKIYTINNIQLYHENIFLIDKKYDLAIFQLNLNNEQNKKILNKIDSLFIFNDEFKSCVATGFPEIGNIDDVKNKSRYYKFKYHREYSDFQYEIQANKILFCNENSQIENMNGFSGSGVLVEGNNNEYYLSGIVIKSTNQGIIICLNLTDLFEEINKNLTDKIQIGGFSYKEILGIEDSKLDLEQIYELIDKKLPLIQDIECSKNKLNFIKTGGEFNKKLKKHAKELDEVPFIYLYQALLFHNAKDHRRASVNFKKAVQYRQDFKAYFYKAKASRQKKIDKTNAPEKNQHSNLEELEYLIENIKYNENKEDYLEYLNKVLPQYKEQKNNEKLEETYMALLSVYEGGNESKEETPIIYYQLAKLSIGNGKYKQSASLLESALKKVNGKGFSQEIKQGIAQIYLSISKKYKKENENRMDFLNKAKKQLQNTPNQTTDLLGKIYINLADCSFKDKDWIKTEESLNKALEIYKELKIKIIVTLILLL